MTHASFNSKTVFDQTKFSGVNAHFVDFSAVLISNTQLNDMFGDASVTLASHHNRPDHWPDIVLDWADFYTEYKKWMEDPEGYKFDRSLYEPNTS